MSTRGIVVFTCDDFRSFDWRPFGATLPRNAKPVEVCDLDTDTVVEIHGFATGSVERAGIIDCRNGACVEMAREFDSRGDEVVS